MNSFYWNLVMWDGETVKVQPKNAKLIQDKIATGEGAITTPTRSIPIKNIKDFVETSERYIDQKLIEAGAKAFNYPIIENDSVMIQWVKKSMPRREYNKHYAYIPAYRKISEQDNYVIIAWKQPVHQINSQTMSELSEDDERNLATRV